MVFPEALVPIKIYVARIPPTLLTYLLYGSDRQMRAWSRLHWNHYLRKVLNLFRVKYSLLKTVHVYIYNKA